MVSLADRRPVGRHLVFHARAADVHAPVCRDLAVGRPAVQGRSVCSVRLDFVVFPLCLSLLLDKGHSQFAAGPFNQIGVENDLDLKPTIRLTDGCLIRENPIGHGLC